jgi:hypothetical protein
MPGEAKVAFLRHWRVFCLVVVGLIGFVLSRGEAEERRKVSWVVWGAVFCKISSVLKLRAGWGKNFGEKPTETDRNRPKPTWNRPKTDMEPVGNDIAMISRRLSGDW